MFQTYTQALIPTLPVFGEDLMMWQAVEHTVHRPWFYVSVLLKEEDMVLRKMLMLSDEHDLPSLEEWVGDDCSIEYVLIATPAHLNGGARWQLEPLEEVTAFVEPGRPYTLIYKVSGGHEYVYGDQKMVRDDHPNRQVLFHLSAC